jgi:hypothetical protein
MHQKDRETKIAQFAKQYGFRLRFYGKGLCAIFDKWPPQAGNVIETQKQVGHFKEP